MEYEELSDLAKLADRVWRHMVFSGRFDKMKASEIKEAHIIPIFGEDVAKEISTYYLTAKI